ncbi:protein of unknown function [Luteibacter sp. UNCMF331Sha3.1]|uniref:YfbM family protein n=1 Tax=Luteibacter sp. UNCMF331Sha3.1 TaxID=1502760 RepID=UPI0008B83CC4|nr:YfbM family protein [Luteibacter sp. UNCMF331Sha3.1]SEM82183.1 protein of unknown function [Luteibacter sp. UNCMF331Sha3.1]
MSMIGRFLCVDAVRGRKLASDEAERADLLAEMEGSGEHAFDANKAWHGMHYALVGSAMPNENVLSLVIFGGDEFGDDLGYGPPRYMDPETVRALSSALDGVDVARIVEELDLEAMDAADVYPGKWAENAEWSRGYIGEYLTPLRDFYRVAAIRGDGVVLWLI